MSESAGSARRLAQVLQLGGRTPLLIDARDRQFSDAATQPLFDWTQQLERGRLLVLPLGEIAAWHAPGARADTPGLLQAACDYDVLVFDGTHAQAAASQPDAFAPVLLEVQPDSLTSAYALLKTRAQSGAAAAILFGDARACTQAKAACARFLGATQAAAVTCLSEEDDAIAALAVRMAGEEQGCRPHYKTGNP